MNAVVVLGIIVFTIWFVHRQTERRQRPQRRSDDAFSHALLPSKDWN